jgi:anti-sigma B factor antagonist
MSQTSGTPGGGASAVTVETRDDGRAIVARPGKKLMDDEALKALRTAIDDACAANPAASLIVVDLSAVGLLPSLALGLLVQIGNKRKARQQKMKLAAVQPQVRQVFAITRLDRVFDFADSVDAAVQ